MHNESQSVSSVVMPNWMYISPMVKREKKERLKRGRVRVKLVT